MRRSHSTRPGFTLAEVLVILAILALLASTLLPAVTNQIRKGGAQSVASDLVALRTGVEMFTSDTNRYPGDVHDLSYAISSTDADISGNNYPPGAQRKWNGPYLDRVMNDADSLPTGLGAYLLDDLTTTTHDNSVDYITARIVGLGSTEFDLIDEIMDAGDGSSGGQLRFVSPGGETPDTLKYLMLPVN